MNYQEHFLSQYTPATAKTNEQVLREATGFIGKPLECASQEDVIGYSTFISHARENTRRRKLATLSAYFKYLQKRDLIEKNPMLAIRLPKVDKAGTIRWIKGYEAESLLDSTTGQERAIIACGLSGLRVSEIRDLNVSQVDADRLRNVVGKGGRIRTVPLTTQAAEAIGGWALGRPDGPLFSLKDGRRISTRSIQNIVSRASTKALGRHLNPHALRHTFGTLGAKADIPALKLATLMGHGDIATAMLYIHFEDEDLLQEVRKLDTTKVLNQKRHLKLVHSKAG